MEINYNGPITYSAEKWIPVPLDIAWDVQINIAEWSKWNTEISRVQLNGPVAPGTTFRWKAGGAPIISEIQEVIPKQRITWTGRMLGIRAIHSWTFEKREDGVQVKTEESFEGFMVKLMPFIFRKILQDSLENSLDALNNECIRINTLHNPLF